MDKAVEVWWTPSLCTALFLRGVSSEGGLGENHFPQVQPGRREAARPWVGEHHGLQDEDNSYPSARGREEGPSRKSDLPLWAHRKMLGTGSLLH